MKIVFAIAKLATAWQGNRTSPRPSYKRPEEFNRVLRMERPDHSRTETGFFASEMKIASPVTTQCFPNASSMAKCTWASSKVAG